MKIEERENTLKIINGWEKKFPVEKWDIEGVHVWPIIKRNIFFNIYYKSTNKPVTKKPIEISLLQRVIRKLGRKPKAWIYYRALKLKKADFLFSGAPSHRISWEGKKYNRYFEPLIDYLYTQGQDSYLLEYKNIDIEAVYEAHRVIDLTRILPLFTRKIKREDFFHKINSLQDYDLFLKEVSQVTGLSPIVFNESILSNIQKVLSWSSLYEDIIKKTKAKFIFGLCYYNNEMLGMNLAAENLNISSVDMQHGTQGELHFAYFFNKIPKNGFNILPNYFWLWDESSFRDIRKWVDRKHFPILGGNPWIEYVDNLDDVTLGNDGEPMILFTLQPLNPIIEDYLLKIIFLTKSKYNWWLRLHPRMSDTEISEFMDKLDEFDVQDCVNLKKATAISLPILLKACDLHISKYSGSIAEAALLGKISLIVDAIGVSSFQDLINSRIAEPCLNEDPDEVIKVIENLIVRSSLKEDKKIVSPRYKNIIDELIKET